MTKLRVYTKAKNEYILHCVQSKIEIKSTVNHLPISDRKIQKNHNYTVKINL